MGAFLGSTSAVAGVVLRCLGIFSCSTAAIAVIITPKLLVLEGLIKLPEGLSTNSNDRSSQESGHEQSQHSFVPVQATKYEPKEAIPEDNEDDEDNNAIPEDDITRYSSKQKTTTSAAESALFHSRSNKVVPGDVNDGLDVKTME